MKRFVDSEIWEKPWYMHLSPEEKLAWHYITARCDNVGVWVPNFKLAEFVMGANIDWEGFRERCNGNLEVLENGKWFVTDFVEFQYGELNERCPPHKSYLRLLEKHGLQRVGVRVGVTLQEKDKDKEEEKEKEGVRVKHEKYGVPMNATRYENLCNEYGKTVVDTYIEKAVNYIASKGKKPYTDYAAAAAQYMKRDNVKPSPRCDNDIPDFIRSEYD